MGYGAEFLAKSPRWQCLVAWARRPRSSSKGYVSYLAARRSEGRYIAGRAAGWGPAPTREGLVPPTALSVKKHGKSVYYD